MSHTHPTLTRAAAHLRALVKQSLLSAGEPPVEASLSAIAGRGQPVKVVDLDCMTGLGLMKSFDQATTALCTDAGVMTLAYRADFGPVAGVVRLSVTVSPEPSE